MSTYLASIAKDMQANFARYEADQRASWMRSFDINLKPPAEQGRADFPTPHLVELLRRRRAFSPAMIAAEILDDLVQARVISASGNDVYYFNGKGPVRKITTPEEIVMIAVVELGRYDVSLEVAALVIALAWTLESN